MRQRWSFHETKMNAALAIIGGLQPKNEAEAMLASQMALTHATAMTFSAAHREPVLA